MYRWKGFAGPFHLRFNRCTEKPLYKIHFIRLIWFENRLSNLREVFWSIIFLRRSWNIWWNIVFVKFCDLFNTSGKASVFWIMKICLQKWNHFDVKVFHFRNFALKMGVKINPLTTGMEYFKINISKMGCF